MISSAASGAAIHQFAGPTHPANQTTLPHILLVLDGFPKSLGGGERIALRLAALLPHYGYRVSILTLSLHPETSALTNPSCPIYLLPLTSAYNLHALRAALVFRRFLKHQNVAVVQTFFESSDIWAGVVTRLASRARLIWSRRDMGILRTAKHRIAYRLLARLPHMVFAVSEQVRRHAIEVDRIPPARVQTIYNGLDLAHWNPASHPPRQHITTIGNIRLVKGHDVLLRAAALVIQEYPQATFSIAGEVLEPAFFAHLQALVHDLHLETHVTFTGGITDLPSHLGTAGIFALPSRSEGFSNAIIEAMAAGLPVVATDVGGNGEAIEHGRTGFIVPPEDPASLAEAILRLLADTTLAQAMGTAGRQRVLDRFTTDAMMRKTTGTYARLLG